jgi:hypothetical protein
MSTQAEQWLQTQYSFTDQQAREVVEGINERLDAERAELRAIVEKLPKNGSDTPMLGGETVWCNPPNIIPREAAKYRVCDGGREATDAPWVLCGSVNVVPVAECYDTREAAEAAGGG